MYRKFVYLFSTFVTPTFHYLFVFIQKETLLLATSTLFVRNLKTVRNLMNVLYISFTQIFCSAISKTGSPINVGVA